MTQRDGSRVPGFQGARVLVPGASLWTWFRMGRCRPGSEWVAVGLVQNGRALDLVQNAGAGDYESLMSVALDLASNARDAGEVPIGAVVVMGDVIVGRGF